jgi:crossover junction endodeoxyribonuclease RusA
MNGPLTVLGVAKPQGSKKVIVQKAKYVGERPRAFVVEMAGPALKEWRHAVSRDASMWVKSHGMPPPIDGAVSIEITFYLPRPKSLPKKIVHNIRQPDVDKLARSAFDSLTKIIYTDDARIIDMNIKKRYADNIPHAVIKWAEVD